MRSGRRRGEEGEEGGDKEGRERQMTEKSTNFSLIVKIQFFLISSDIQITPCSVLVKWFI